MKLLLDILDTVKNISMVKLKIVKYRDMWMIVDEFGAFVEKCAVILIRLNHEPLRRAQFCSFCEVSRLSANQIARVYIGLGEYPCDHGCGSCLPVRAGNGNHFSVGKNMVMQPL